MWSDDPALIDRIYEAGAMPELWSTLLDELVDRSAAKASSISSLADNRMRWAGSKVTREELMPAFVADGWAASDPRLAVLLTTPHAGFLTVRDIYPQAELERHPIYSQWLVPHDLVIALGTVIQGAGGEHVLIAVEGFKSHEASRQATAALDPLRPHLARAAALSSQLQLERVKAAVAALEMIGVPAAVIDGRGRLQQANGLFAGLTGQSVFDRRERLQWADPKSDLQYRDAVAALAAGRPGRSIVLRRAGEAPIAMHVLPIRGSARDIFQQSMAILILASGAAKSTAAPILLQALFDLSPAEARVVSLIGEGRRPAEIGKTLKLSDETVRSHLKSAFLKTNTNRQSELAALVAGYGAPGGR